MTAIVVSMNGHPGGAFSSDFGPQQQQSPTRIEEEQQQQQQQLRQQQQREITTTPSLSHPNPSPSPSDEDESLEPTLSSSNDDNCDWSSEGQKNNDMKMQQQQQQCSNHQSQDASCTVVEDNDDEKMEEAMSVASTSTPSLNDDDVVDEQNNDVAMVDATTNVVTLAPPLAIFMDERSNHNNDETMTSDVAPAPSSSNSSALDVEDDDEVNDQNKSPADHQQEECENIGSDNQQQIIDESCENIAMQTSSSSSTSSIPMLYGGLNNLGNTCYLNSAIQMLASIEGFTESIKSLLPPSASTNNTEAGDEKNDNDSNNDDDNLESPESNLREALLDVLDRLSKGETVRPDHFKNQMDERSSLFIGYLQQDSHEFLTTLLDLLDEDYKKKVEENEDNDEDQNKDGDDNDKQDKDMDDNDEQLQEENEEQTQEPQQQQQQQQQQQTDEEDGYVIVMKEEEQPQEQDSTEKKNDSETVDENNSKTLDEGVVSSPDAPGITATSSSSSLLNLQYEDIEDLLHGKESASTSTESATTETQDADNGQQQVEEPAPKCKLVGGRMSMSGVVLTPLKESCSAGGVDGVTTGGTAPALVANSLNNESEAGDSSAAAASDEEPTGPISPVDSYFKTEVRVCLTCESCKYTRSHLETFYHLSLELDGGEDSNEGTSTISPMMMDIDDIDAGNDNGYGTRVEDSLRKFFAPERREIKCEKCFCDTALQTMEITRLPRALLLHFKRFLVDISPDYTSITYRKNTSPVSFDTKLSLEESGVLAEFFASDVTLPSLSSARDDDSDAIVVPSSPSSCSSSSPSRAGYQIRSVVNHIGSSASCGHYTADAVRLYGDVEHEQDDNKSIKGNSERTWTRFNDSHVSKISSEQAIDQSSRTAYMIMYEIA